ncbi:MAG TPA: sigma-70 family RNA polymerase sigma factor [Kofleriaceae bacterium]|jgi:RNA polymerase sigma-70 factor (ECF subfamily)
MSQIDHAAFTAQLLAQLREGRAAEAATDALRMYGPEIYALFASVHRNEQDAGEVFSLYCELLWRGLTGFEGRALFRTWIYTIAWNASSRFRSQQRARREELSPDSQLARLAEQVRVSTMSRLRLEQRTKIQVLRETLPVEDQMLLILRVERELEWTELVRVMSPDADVDAATLTRESARLRKRFQAVKERLRELVRAAG